VDLNTGQQVLWGLPGLDHAPVADAVFASSALPGILPPRTVAGRVCIDGAVIENLPIRAALTQGHLPIVAIDVGGARVERNAVERKGFVTVYSRGLEIVMQTLAASYLDHWTEPPVVLIRPHVERISMFAFHRTAFLIAEGYRAVIEALDRLPARIDELAPGLHPQRDVGVGVVRERCVRCGLCAAREPALFRLGADGIAESAVPRQRWSPIGDSLLSICPSHAITAAPVASAPP
jgi:predicted acylesterase/phospholipase RssA/ferredoxin